MSPCSTCLHLLKGALDGKGEWFGIESSRSALGALLRSSSGCQCCKFLREGLEYSGCLEHFLLGEYASVFVLPPGDSSAGLLIGIRHGHQQVSGVEYITPLERFPFPGKSLDNSSGWRTSGDTSTSDAFACIRRWLSTCNTDLHSRCCSGEPAVLPKRIVDVTNDKIRLYETKGEVSRYACLSHCWGKQQIIVTTSKNKDGHFQSIPWNDLSKTFQDAIECTRRLGLDYIWIDSLCIIQDDIADWNDQAPLMAEYYSRAYITLAATASSSGSGGLFRKYSQYDLDGPIIDGRKSRVVARRQMDHLFNISEVDPDAFPLLTRAWVYQERLLSARVVHFGPQELSWECNQIMFCECGYANFSQGRTSNWVLSPKTTLSKLLEDAVDEKGLPRLQSCWRRIVSNFSNLNLTKYPDRLPAIAGLAKTLGPYRKSSPPRPLYAYGIWIDSAIADLLWHTPNPDRPERLAAPSWSWAAVNTHVIHGCQVPEYTPEREYATVLSINGNHFDKEGWMPQGGSGELVIEGQLVELTVVKWEKGDGFAGPSFSGLNVERSGNRATVTEFDLHLPLVGTDYSLVPGDRIWGLRMAGDEVPGDPFNDEDEVQVQVLSLMLRKLDNQGLVFERIGYVAATMPEVEESGGHWYNGVPRQAVTIK